MFVFDRLCSVHLLWNAVFENKFVFHSNGCVCVRAFMRALKFCMCEVLYTLVQTVNQKNNRKKNENEYVAETGCLGHLLPAYRS